MPLYSYCRSLLREPADAADAVQDTFLIATAKLGSLRDAGKLRSWLYAVARNECHRRLRSGQATSALDEVADLPAPAATPAPPNRRTSPAASNGPNCASSSGTRSRASIPVSGTSSS